MVFKLVVRLIGRQFKSIYKCHMGEALTRRPSAGHQSPGLPSGETQSPRSCGRFQGAWESFGWDVLNQDIFILFHAPVMSILDAFEGLDEAGPCGLDRGLKVSDLLMQLLKQRFHPRNNMLSLYFIEQGDWDVLQKRGRHHADHTDLAVGYCEYSTGKTTLCRSVIWIPYALA